MKKSKFIFKLVLISLILNLSTPLFCEETKKNDELPQVVEDIRRFEVITLGALPFVFLDSTLVYSGIRYFANGMDNQYKPGLSPNLSQQEQTGIFFTSLGISFGIGITDLIVNIVKRNKKSKKKEAQDNSIIITPISEDPTATKIEIPDNLKTKDKDNKNEEPIEISEDD